jgi:site-specific recombinase XerD
MTIQAITQADQKAIATQDFIAQWLDRERMRGQSNKTLEAYRRGFERFGRWLADQGITEPGARDIALFKSDLSNQYAPQTVNLALSAVKSFYRYLVEVGAIGYSPAGDVRGVKRSKSRRHKRSALTVSEVRAVLDTCDRARDLAIIALMAYCGLRTIEIHRANIDGLGTEGERMVLKVQGKGRVEADEIAIIPRSQEPIIRAWLSERRRLDPKSPALFVSLSNRTQGERLSTRAIRDIITGHFEKAGVIGETKTTHSLRHTAITQAIKNGGSPMQVQAMARHASFDTTLGYIHEVNRVENPAEDLITY